MEEKKSSSNTPTLRREKSDLTGGGTTKWVGEKPSASKNPFRYSYTLFSYLLTLVDIYLGTASFLENTFAILTILITEFRNK